MSEEVYFEDQPQEPSKESAQNTDSNQKQNSSTKKPNAKLTSEYSSPSSENAQVSISLPSVTLDELQSYTKTLQESDESIENKSQEWQKTLSDSVDFYTPNSLYQSRFTDEDSEFLQGLKTQDSIKTISKIKFKSTEGEIRGDAAVLKVSKLLGLGDVLSIPLPHSGFWVTLKPPTEKDLIDFYNSLFKQKIILGRSTFGLTLSNFSVHINQQLFDFIIKHIHSVSLSGVTKENIDSHILIHDLPILAWGFACTIYPNGFDYSRACINKESNCSYVAKALLNLTKLLWIDNSSLSENQKAILGELRPNKVTQEAYKTYISQHTRVKPSKIKINEQITLNLKIPTLQEYFTDGLSWVNIINSRLENAIIDNADKEQEIKTELLAQYVKSSALRQFSHFIDYIEVEENTVTDRESINAILEVLSAQDDLREKISKEILDFKSSTTIGLIGIPEFKCPKCSAEQNPDPVNENFVNVIALDVMNLFFTLITLKIAKIIQRQI